MVIWIEWGICDVKDEICSRLFIFYDDIIVLSLENFKFRFGIYELFVKLGLIFDRMLVLVSDKCIVFWINKYIVINERLIFDIMILVICGL